MSCDKKIEENRNFYAKEIYKILLKVRGISYNFDPKNYMFWK